MCLHKYLPKALFFFRCVLLSLVHSLLEPCHSMTTEFWQQHFHNLLRRATRCIYRELSGIIAEKSMTMVSACCATMTVRAYRNDIIYLRGNWRSIFCSHQSTAIHRIYSQFRNISHITWSSYFCDKSVVREENTATLAK